MGAANTFRSRCSTSVNYGFKLATLIFATVSLVISATYGSDSSITYASGTSLSASSNAPSIIELPPEEHLTVNLDANSTVKLQVSNISASVRYILFQAHCQKYPVTLKYVSQNAKHGDFVTDKDIGLVVLLYPGDTSAVVYLANPAASSVSALLLAQAYKATDPIPGGCNMEFSVEIAPYLKVNYDAFKTEVIFQHASVGFPRYAVQPSCDLSYVSFKYDVYLYYITERNLSEQLYFDAIKLMTDVANIEKHAQLINPLFGMARTIFDVATYRRQGSIFAVVIRTGSNVTRAIPYVPASSYGCNISGDVDNCIDILTVFEWLLAVFGAIGGLFLCFLGHRFFKIAMFAFGFTSLSLVTYILMEKFADTDYNTVVVITFVLGFAGGCGWVIFWWFVGMPVLSILLVGLNFGFMVSSVALFTPLGFLRILENDANYWILFSCIVLVIPVILLSFTQKLNVATCALIGSYAAVVLLDRYAGGCLTYVILNVIRRAVVPGYNHVINPVPFQMNDIILSCLWGGLFFGGCAFQLWREKNKPPFPISPYRALRMRQHQAGRVLTNPSSPEDVDGGEAENAEYDTPYQERWGNSSGGIRRTPAEVEVTEREPLLPPAAPWGRDKVTKKNGKGYKSMDRPLPYS